jgi:hypothetical protein
MHTHTHTTPFLPLPFPLTNTHTHTHTHTQTHRPLAHTHTYTPTHTHTHYALIQVFYYDGLGLLDAATVAKEFVQLLNLVRIFMGLDERIISTERLNWGLQNTEKDCGVLIFYVLYWLYVNGILYNQQRGPGKLFYATMSCNTIYT